MSMHFNKDEEPQPNVDGYAWVDYLIIVCLLAFFAYWFIN